MFSFFKKKEEKTNYAKIIAITLAVVAAASAIAYVVFKLYQKFFAVEYDDEELFDECCCDDCDICIEGDADTDEVEAAE